ncbi:MAG TPA: hypothetical protein VHJ69_09880 [Gemmatimonadales bacterium]|jgi:hypothetical protein|nr:hypothetical protein [Gemmatimonadales bacterium]
MERPVREARLRAEYVKLYPGLSANVWLPASEVAEHIIAVVRHEGGRLGAHGRMMAEDHFEFRGGRPPADRSARNERREDRLTESR